MLLCPVFQVTLFHLYQQSSYNKNSIACQTKSERQSRKPLVDRLPYPPTEAEKTIGQNLNHLRTKWHYCYRNPKNWNPHTWSPLWIESDSHHQKKNH
jgi:hypothetical protein